MGRAMTTVALLPASRPNTTRTGLGGGCRPTDQDRNRLCTIRDSAEVATPRASELLRLARSRASLSQTALAARAGVAQSVISVYESGRRQPSLPTLLTLIRTAGSDVEIRLRPRTAGNRLVGPLGRRLRAHRADVAEITRRHGVELLGVFGSVARGMDEPGSDVDLLVTLPDGLGLVGLGRVTAELERVLQTRVDLVPAADLKPGVRQTVMAELVPL